MCRLFGSLSVRPCAPSGFLFGDEHSLLNQSNADPERLQAEGWGLVFMDGQMRTVRSTGAIFEQSGRFREIVGSIRSNLILAHIRRASNPLGLGRAELMRPENIQPFTVPGLSFIHNGTVNFPNNVELGEYRDMLDGSNDSEVLFWLLAKHLGEHDDVGEALISLEHALCDSAEDGKDPFTALNIIFTDGTGLHAYCRYLKQPGAAICSKDRGYYTMCYLPGNENVVVMSEPSNEDGAWKPLGNGDLLTAHIEGDAVVHTVRNLQP